MVYQTPDVKTLLDAGNLEYYLMERIPQQLIFNKILPAVPNKRKLFSTVDLGNTVQQDIDAQILSDPLMQSEGVHFTEIKLTKYKMEQGTFYRVGFMFKYSDDELVADNAIIDFQMKLDEISTALALTVNRKIGNDLLTTPGLKIEDMSKAPPVGDNYLAMSNWGTNPMVRTDMNHIRNFFNKHSSGFKLGNVMVSRDVYSAVVDYKIGLSEEKQPIPNTYNDTSLSFNADAIDVDGTPLINVEEGFDQAGIPAETGKTPTNFVGLAKNVPVASVEVYTNPKFSLLARANQAKSEMKSGSKGDLPMAMINTAEWKDPNSPDVQGNFFWMDFGLNIRNPKGIITGAIETKKTSALSPNATTANGKGKK
jgi:hypothetical protein